MRAAFLALPLLVLLASSAQCADEAMPAPPTSNPDAAASSASMTTTAEAATPPAASEQAAAAESATPPATRERATAADSATPAATSEQAATAESATPPVAPTAAEHSTISSGETAAISGEAPQTEETMDVQMRRLGYTPKTIDGQKRYCKASTTLGSRFNAKTICWTADQIKSQEAAVQKVREKQGQRETWGQ